MSKVLKKGIEPSPGAEPLVMEVFSGESEAGPEGVMKVGGDEVAIEREAYEKGFASGRKAGFELGRREAEVLFGRLGGIVSDLSAFRAELYGRCEREITALVLAIAGKVIKREIADDDETVVRAVRAAVAAAASGGGMVIKVNPRDFDVVREYADEIITGRDGAGQAPSGEVSIAADESISRGGCVVETALGEVDATIEGLLAEMEERLNDER